MYTYKKRAFRREAVAVEGRGGEAGRGGPFSFKAFFFFFFEVLCFGFQLFLFFLGIFCVILVIFIFIFVLGCFLRDCILCNQYIYSYSRRSGRRISHPLKFFAGTYMLEPHLPSPEALSGTLWRRRGRAGWLLGWLSGWLSGFRGTVVHFLRGTSSHGYVG